MILLLTSAGDGTSDRLAHHFKDEIFRLNYDQLPEFKISFSLNEWEIKNPVGRRISSDNAKTVIWWKAFISSPKDYDKFLKAESKYFFWELYSWFRDYGKIKGNSIDFHNKFGKIRIARYASKYFATPKTLITYNLHGEHLVPIGNRIVKSLSSELMQNNLALFTTDVSNKPLDPNFPWFIQEKILALADITFFIVGKKIFGFSRSRKNLKGLDWRAEQTFDFKSDEWEYFPINDEITNKLIALNSDLQVDWGRYDFMLNEENQLVFLEFNPNGQWVFLDFNNKHGLMDAVIKYLKE